jgi:hypothetical protein
MCRAPPTMSESGQNASGQEAFGNKIKEMPVVITRLGKYRTTT